MGIPRKQVASLFSRNSTTAQTDPDTQPGLEAVPVDGLEPVHDPSSYHGLQVYENAQQPQENMYKSYEEAAGGHHAVDAEAKARKKKKWTMTIVIGLAVLIGIAIAVGVGVGVGLKKSDDGDDSSSPSSGTNSTGGSPEASTYVMNNDAPLTYTSSGQIFFQDKDGNIIFTQNQPSRKRAVGNQTMLKIPDSIAPKPNTPLATVDWDDGEWIYLFYLTKNNRLHDYIFTGGKWQEGRLAKGRFEAYGQSKLAAARLEQQSELRVFYQKANGKIVELVLDLNASLESGSWKTTPQNPSALLGTGLAAISYFKNQLRFYFQIEDRKIVEQCWPASGVANVTDDEANNWLNCKFFDSLKDGSVEQRAKGLTAIAAARVEDARNQTLMLYQAEDGTLAGQRWDDDEETWIESPTNAGQLADKGKIAARIDSSNTISAIYRSADEEVRSITWDVDSGWTVDQQPAISD